MNKIKKIISLCPALPGWRAIFEDGEYFAVAAWVLVKMDDDEQCIVPLSSGFVPGETMSALQLELDNCYRIEFSGDKK